ncbi:histone deacetylase 11-like isoform X2 [Clavelina lepadiformis]|uniref:histone deacetylase 11-like isoform X2 n=1 Tax=Clavelina lepadiformis TaxID=159417 RepID=UPI0040429E7A
MLIKEYNKLSTLCRMSKLYDVTIKESSWPILYHKDYNISFFGMEKMHPFDSGKWGRVHQLLVENELFEPSDTITPNEASEDDLLQVHNKEYLDSLKWSWSVAKITEVPPVAFLPNFIVQRRVLYPFRLQTGGSILAGDLAMKFGWAINIGGGFHHCSKHNGGGFCAYADITLLIKFAMENSGVSNVMIIDLDAHQGNGYARDFMDYENVYILDVFNRNIYPHDGYAKTAIKRKVELRSYVSDVEYLQLVEQHTSEALAEFNPDLIVYNAGTDILDGDPLGCLSISPTGIIKRDHLVFSCARKKNIPIVMLTSGGYQRTTARIIADSILSLHSDGLIPR